MVARPATGAPGGAHGRMVPVDRRLLVGSIAAAAVIAIGGGWAIASRDGDDGADDDVVLETPGVVQDPTLGTNAPVQGDPLPDVTLRDVGGNDVALVSLLDQPLVVNFWNTTCVPCRKEMPVLGATASALDGEVRFVGVNTFDAAGAAADFAAEHGAEYLQLLDPNGELVTPAGVGVLPSTLFVDTTGQIVLQRSGELTQEKLDAALAEAFPEPG